MGRISFGRKFAFSAWLDGSVTVVVLKTTMILDGTDDDFQTGHNSFNSRSEQIPKLKLPILPPKVRKSYIAKDPGPITTAILATCAGGDDDVSSPKSSRGHRHSGN